MSPYKNLFSTPYIPDTVKKALRSSFEYLDLIELATKSRTT